MRFISAGSLSYPYIPKNKRLTQTALAGLVTGCLILSGCGAYPSNGRSPAMLGSSAAEEISGSTVDRQVISTKGNIETPKTASSPTGSTSQSANIEGPGGTPVAGSTDRTRDAEAAEVNVNTANISNHLAVNLNSLGKLRGRLFLAPSSLSCTQSSVTGAGTDSCTVTLTSAAPSGGEIVSLSSNNSAVRVPSSTTVPNGATSATFTASISSVSVAEAVTLTAATNAGSKVFNLQLSAAIPILSASTTTINFGNVTAGQSATQSLTLSSTGTSPVTISSLSIAGSLFISSGIATPVTLNPGQKATLSLQFTSPHVSTFTGVLTISSNSSQGNIAVNMSAAGVAAPAALNAVSCSAASMGGAGSVACTVSLTAAAPTSGMSISLASNNASLTVPASVTVPASATSVGFTAAAAAVGSSQTATITASAGGTSTTFALQLSPAGKGTLSVNATTVSFGSVVVNAIATQSVTLSSTGASAVTVNSASITGSGFTESGITFPLTLNPGQTATLSVQFDPTATGAATGTLTLASNSSTGGTTAISLSGTGQPHEVDLSWDAPSNSSVPISGYHIYRATQGSSSYQLLNSSVDPQTSYTDSTGQSGAAYQYYVTTVDSAGVESGPSNSATVTIP